MKKNYIFPLLTPLKSLALIGAVLLLRSVGADSGFGYHSSPETTDLSTNWSTDTHPWQFDTSEPQVEETSYGHAHYVDEAGNAWIEATNYQQTPAPNPLRHSGIRANEYAEKKNPPVIKPIPITKEGIPTSYPFEEDLPKELAQVDNLSSPTTNEAPIIAPTATVESAPIATPPILDLPEPAEKVLDSVPADSPISPIVPAPESVQPPTSTTETATTPQSTPISGTTPEPEKTKTEGQLDVGPVNFNNLAVIEYIRFISRISGKNFVFEEEDLPFTVTIVSKEATTVDDLVAALLQELRIRDLSLIEQNNTLIIHRNPRIRSPGHIITNESTRENKAGELITRVFRLNTLDPSKAVEVIKPLLSDDSLVEYLKDSNNLIITDLHSNIEKVAQLIDNLDAPNSGVTVGQYVVKNGFVDSLVELATRIISPIAQGNPFVLVPHPSSNSIYIVSNAFIVEKALGVLQNLDSNDGKTKIFSMDQLKPQNGQSAPSNNAATDLGTAPQTDFLNNGGKQPSVLNENSEFSSGGISTSSRWSNELPTGHIERTLFFIYKLKYRRGDQIEISLRKIANSLMATGVSNVDLVSAINSAQWIDSSNSLIFTGTVSALEKIKDLMLEIDTPLRQVYIEMLILDTTLVDSLTYGVDWGVVFGGGGTTGGETFINNPDPGKALIRNLEPAIKGGNPAKTLLNGLDKNGLNLGIIGEHLFHNGNYFSSISALVRALHSDDKSEILMTPRIITEDNVTAEIFVGGVDRYKTQSISNDQGNVITNNFEFLDVGTTLRVTPLINNNGIITLDIIEEVTKGTSTANTTNATNFENDVNMVRVLDKNRTTTRIHVPNGYFVVMSGMIHTDDNRFVNQIPCLGGIPILGATGKYKSCRDVKRNLMIFIRPLIVDTADELEDITKRQQDVYRQKSRSRRMWNYEIDEMMDFLNLKPTDRDEMDQCNYFK